MSKYVLLTIAIYYWSMSVFNHQSNYIKQLLQFCVKRMYQQQKYNTLTSKLYKMEYASY